MRPLLAVLLLAATTVAADDGLTAEQLVRAAMDHWRGLTSYSVMRMTIHRPDWERSMTLRGWSRGDEQSLIRVIDPRKDAGNGTLLDDQQMWSYSPRINRIVKVPSSMMAQSWMGSDFSNKDISKSTEILDEYDHTLIATDDRDGHRFYTVRAVPHDDAAVVWGREELVIRDDYVLAEHRFYDQDGALVKRMVTTDIEEMGGRTVARTMRMGKVDAPDEWTEVETLEVDFDIDLPPETFTLANLRNPRS